MELTLFLAKIIGIYMLVGGLSGAFYPDRIQKAMMEIRNSYLLPYFDGALALIIGLVLVLIHNVWSSPVAIIISLVGWIAVLEGIAMMLLPHNMIASITKLFASKKTTYAWSIAAILLGIWLTYMGFAAY